MRRLIYPFFFMLFLLVGCGKEPRAHTILENSEAYSDTLLQNAVIYYKIFGSHSQQLQALCLLGHRYVEEGRYGDALDVYRQAESIPIGRLSDSERETLLECEIELLEYISGSLELFRPNKTEWRIITLIVLLIIQLLTITIMLSQFRKHRRDEHELRDLYNNLLSEYSQIRKLPLILSDFPPGSDETIKRKIRALGAFFTNDTPESLEIVNDQLDSLTQNRKDLLETIGMLYATYRPRFVSCLLESNLTTLEVGYCCLLVIGLRTGEMKDIINRSGVYNINVVIRRKLKIESNSSTLSAFLKKLYSELEG